MKEIKFTPLRRIKKTGKITVAGYMQWRKLQTLNEQSEYFGGQFSLIIGSEHLNLDPNERVYNHKGELLFWFKHYKCHILPKNYTDDKTLAFLYEEFEGELWKLSKLNEPVGKGFHYSVKGFDCDGVPVFSHNTQDYITTHYNDLSQFEILTVGMVVKWYGWFLYQLNNAALK